MGLFGPKVWKIRDKGDVRGIVAYMDKHPKNSTEWKSAVVALGGVGHGAVPQLIALLEESALKDSAALGLCIFGDTSLAALQKLSRSAGADGQRGALVGLLAMAQMSGSCDAMARAEIDRLVREGANEQVRAMAASASLALR